MAKKKLQKKIEGNVISIQAMDGAQGEMTFNFDLLPEGVQQKLGPFGLSHKLGDAAAGKTGVEAEESIIKVWEGLKNGDWSVRLPAAPKVSTKTISTNLDNLSAEEQDIAKAILAKLGIKLPGITAPAIEPEEE